jgi:hypothetical protein
LNYLKTSSSIFCNHFPLPQQGEVGPSSSSTPSIVLFDDSPSTDALPSFLDGLIASPKVHTTKREGIGACSLAYSTLGVKGHAGIPRWGLGILTNNSITHTNLQKPNNKLISA